MPLFTLDSNFLSKFSWCKNFQKAHKGIVLIGSCGNQGHIAKQRERSSGTYFNEDYQVTWANLYQLRNKPLGIV